MVCFCIVITTAAFPYRETLGFNGGEMIERFQSTPHPLQSHPGKNDAAGASTLNHKDGRFGQ